MSGGHGWEVGDTEINSSLLSLPRTRLVAKRMRAARLSMLEKTSTGSNDENEEEEGVQIKSAALARCAEDG